MLLLLLLVLQGMMLMRAKAVGSRAALRRRCRWRIEVGRCQITGRAAGRAAVDAADAAIAGAGRAAAVVVVGHYKGKTGTERERGRKGRAS